MTKKYEKSIFIFRRDHRLNDNLGLMEALKNSEEVLPIFIMTPEQLDDKKNQYKSDNCVQFMFESLDDLDQNLKKKKSKLFYFYGTPHEVVEDLMEKVNDIEAVYVNMDYSPYSKKRDQEIEKVCQEFEVDFHSVHDCLLNPVGSILTKSDNTFYQKFTPYFREATKESVPKPKLNAKNNYVKSTTRIPGQFSGSTAKFYKKNEDIWVEGGRKEGLKILSEVKDFKKYNKERNDLNKETTNLSAYIKFGCVSIREVYHKFLKELGKNNDLIKQLYWRDFYHNILYDNPHVVGGAMKKKYNDLEWKNNRTHFKKWCQGETGYPVIDAAMRSMNQTGYMHNRARLIVSNFLIKVLMIDWRWGEKYFSQKLVDIDIANNNGNWQWGAGTGADSQPYFRTFNPWLQSSKYDPDATYIKKWVPELEDVPAKHLHKWNENHKKYDEVDYPEPIVDYKEGKEEG